MARGRRRARPALTRYERRIYNRLGMLPSEARSRGISLAAARGHRARAIEPGGEAVPEHRLRDIRRTLRGEALESDRRFVRAQARRSGSDYSELLDTYMDYTPAQRAAIRSYVGAAHRWYLTHHGAHGAADYYKGEFPELPDFSDAPQLAYYRMK